MTTYQDYTIEKPLRLEAGTLDAIRQLVEACEVEDHAPARISWGMLQARPGTTPLDFCCYQDGKLVGYLFLDDYDPRERETVILVHPAYRRRGIAHALLAGAYEECRHAGVGQIILVCEQRSAAGKAFADHYGARFDFAEHEMVLGEFQPRNARVSHLSIRPAEFDDLDALVSIQASSFGDPEDEVRQRLTQRLQSQRSKMYIALLAAEQADRAAPVGMFRLTAEDHETGIYGLGVAPAYQGRGYGRQMVEEAIRIARSADPQEAVMLDVEVENTRAFNLYLSCGFRVRATYDYYALSVGEAEGEAS